MGSSSSPGLTAFTNGPVPSSYIDSPLSQSEQLRSRVIDYVERELLGTPWEHQQRTPGVGIDCIGMILVCSWMLGEQTQDFKAYGREPKSDILVRETAKRATRIELSQSLPADFFIFWTNDKTRRPRHYGMLGYNRVLYHTDVRLGGVTRQDISAWEHRIHSAWRFNSVALD